MDGAKTQKVVTEVDGNTKTTTYVVARVRERTRLFCLWRRLQCQHGMHGHGYNN